MQRWNIFSEKIGQQKQECNILLCPSRSTADLSPPLLSRKKQRVDLDLSKNSEIISSLPTSSDEIMAMNSTDVIVGGHGKKSNIEVVQEDSEKPVNMVETENNNNTEQIQMAEDDRRNEFKQHLSNPVLGGQLARGKVMVLHFLPILKYSTADTSILLLRTTKPS